MKSVERKNFKNKNHAKMRLIIGVIVLGITFPGLAQANSNFTPASSMEDLYRVVRENTLHDNEVNKQRIREFQNKTQQQQELLSQEQEKISRLDEQGDSLNTSITNNELELEELENSLNKKLGNFGELFGVTRQVAGDTRAQIQNSLISAQFPDRHFVLDEIAGTKKLPTTEQLRQLWSVLLQEQIQQGEISRFSSEVINEQGIPVAAEVTRVGPFVAVANGKFLGVGLESQSFSFLPSQPANVFSHTARELGAASGGSVINIAIDPSRGAILDLLPEIPSLLEQYHQGGLPGYLVTVLAVIGLAIGLQRLIALWWTTLKVQKQIKSENISGNNPLGRVLNVHQKNKKIDIGTLELKLEDAVLKEVPKLDKGLNTLKVLAAVAPLLGLLGTVLGMILTFQTITLWGAGDVKLMADGISQALVTTVQGLVAAIPLLLLHSVANGRARILQQILEEQSAGLIAAKAEASYE